jgi:uncharacterized protein
VIALDTNILVHAHRREMQFHERAGSVLRMLATGTQIWALPWPVAHEFYRVVTDPRIFKTPSPPKTALDQLVAWTANQNCRLLAEADDHLAQLRDLAVPSDTKGAHIHDARIAAICLSHGVDRLWTADRDFSYFPQLKTTNPLVM